MSENWKVVKVGDVCVTNKRTYSLSENWDFVNYLDTGNLTQDKVNEYQKITIGTDQLPSRARRKVGYNDILYSTVRPNQLHYGIVKNIVPNMLVSTGFTVITADTEQADSDYLYYFLTQDSITETLHAIGEQSTSAYPSIKPSDIENLDIVLPSLEKQREIGRTLRVIDEKIENNRKINHHLEQIAQAIFKSWFVVFEPFADGEFFDSEMGSVPTGWQVMRIGDLPVTVTDYVANGSFASLKENVTLLETPSYAVFIRNVDLKAGSFAKYVDEHSYHFLSKSALFGGEVIISNVGDVGSVFLCPYLPQSMTLGNNMIMLTANERKAQNYFFYLLFKHSYGAELIRSITGGSAQPKFNKTDFRSLRVLMPPSVVMDKFLDTVECLFQQQADLVQENSRLTELRDTLLPRLMSGELSVADLADIGADK